MASPTADLAAAGEALRWVVAASLAMARPVGILLIMPVFTRVQTGSLVRLGIAFALAAPLVSGSRAGLPPADDLALGRLALTTAKEVFVGLLIGYLSGLPLWAIQAVGEVVEVQRGASSQTIGSDPATRSEASAFGLFMGLTASAIFVAADGLRLLTDTLYRSYGLWPLHALLPPLRADSLREIGFLTDRLLETALRVGGPVIALLLLLDLALMLLARFAPQLALNDLSPTVKNVAFLVFLPLYAGALLDASTTEILGLHGLADRLRLFAR